MLGRPRASITSYRRPDSVPIVVPAHINYLVWKIVMAKVATLQEINTYYDINDVLDANELLALQEQAVAQDEERAKLNRGLHGR